MPPPLGSKNALGNKGGRRKGYEYEKDQLVKLRQQIDRMLSKMEAMDKGKLSDRGIEQFRIQLPVYLKAMDKLHATKTTSDLNVTLKPIPILHYVRIHNGLRENIQLKEEDSGSPGGNVSLQDSINHPVVD